ncbi:hypothetical protein G7Y89_g15411 [Cudoniella acicularis]|uniref:C2H2-type domain-containing protein n=1 Tax=Cudoniella acicularis TaxID=354080 RepID=A0A8H4QNS3_9HELO|nr:hypothetical protein G7Y89_g15411 [Cudoniella acicularis]
MARFEQQPKSDAMESLFLREEAKVYPPPPPFDPTENFERFLWGDSTVNIWDPSVAEYYSSSVEGKLGINAGVLLELNSYRPPTPSPSLDSTPASSPSCFSELFWESPEDISADIVDHKSISIREANDLLTEMNFLLSQILPGTYYNESDIKSFNRTSYPTHSLSVRDITLEEVFSKYPSEGDSKHDDNKVLHSDHNNFNGEVPARDTCYLELGSPDSFSKGSTQLKLEHNPSPMLSCDTTLSDFETDSSYSEEEDDWGDSSSTQDSETPAHLGFNHTVPLTENVFQPDLLFTPVLDRMKQGLVDSIMREFWVVFHQEWTSNIKKCGGGSPDSMTSSVSRNRTSGDTSQNMNRRKHGHGDGDGENPNNDDDSGRDIKRQKIGQSSSPVIQEGPMFACPYRKHNPRKYRHTTRKWRSCALTPLKDISRVKLAALFCLTFYCQRCKEFFEKQEDLESHLQRMEGCEFVQAEPADGILIGGSVQNKIRDRKKTYPGQTEMEKWQELYKILFPMEDIPSPYFQAVQDESVQSPDSTELSNYEDYSRQQLPRYFRDALQAIVAEEAQPIEERLKSRLVDLIQDCQERVFSTYRDRLRVNSSPLNMENDCQRLHLQARISLYHMESTLTNLPEKDTVDRLGSFYQRPPPLATFEAHPDIPLSEIGPAAAKDHSDSGYVSNRSPSQLDNFDRIIPRLEFDCQNFQPENPLPEWQNSHSSSVLTEQNADPSTKFLNSPLAGSQNNYNTETLDFTRFFQEFNGVDEWAAFDADLPNGLEGCG